MSKVSCVLFDLGGVLVNWHNAWLIEEVSKKFLVSKDNLQHEFEKNLAILSSGLMDESEFWSKIGEKLDSEQLKQQNSLLEPIFRKFVTPNDHVIELSKKIKHEGTHIGILSNTEPVTFSVVEEIFPISHFDFKFLSYEIGHVKPDPMIYKHVTEKIPFNKEELFFIDDLESNVNSANDFGIKTIQFVGYEKLLDDLKKNQIL